ncbi:MAG: FAD binding domain-containing protein, partial [Armatimonadota bacterium]
LLVEAAAQIGGGMQVRNRGTIGGAVSSGNPAYDFAPCLVAIDAEVRLVSASGERRVRAAQFFTDAFVTAARADELLAGICIPANGAQAAGPSTRYAYEKLKFTDGCYCIASAACVVRMHADGTLASVRLALGGVEAVPVRLDAVEARLAGARLTGGLLDDVAALARKAVASPIDDVMADGEYRRAMAGVVARRALARAAARAGGARPGSA